VEDEQDMNADQPIRKCILTEKIMIENQEKEEEVIAKEAKAKQKVRKAIQKWLASIIREEVQEYRTPSL
jgi:hypothetical protein